MFAAIYAFEVKPGHESAFVQSWADLTRLIRTHEGALGSRLHRGAGQTFIAYAQWPDRETWDRSGDKMPKAEADDARQRMRLACDKVETLHQLEMVEDLLVPLSATTPA